MLNSTQDIEPQDNTKKPVSNEEDANCRVLTRSESLDTVALLLFKAITRKSNQKIEKVGA
ncbi:hypothetical protein QNH39_27780 [Neobacillus novalis]|uniref:Uncharacterized protein n=1 Tax=Neobacillus novalis TaxID=220687 RepID=A0AA95SGR6_9BACI|nr:hypothetical protein [Neobacillus novalis]WHY86321.1 hypothetical protein QNH39_27780 [Neobacillus novalis]